MWPGRKRRRTSIRLRILALICLAALPLSAERIMSLINDRQAQIAAAEEKVRDLARRAAFAQQEALASARAVLDVLSRQSGALLHDREACNAQMELLVREIIGIQSLALADPEGIVMCANSPAALGKAAVDRGYLHAVVTSGETVMSALMASPVTGRNSIFLARADRGPSGGPVAVTLVGIDLQWLSRIAARTAVGAGVVVDIIGQHGAVIVRYPLGADLVGRHFPDHPLTAAVLSAEDGVVTVPGYDGEKRIYAFMRFEGTSVHIAVGMDARRIVAPIDQKIYATAVAHLAALACFLLLSWLAAERLIGAPIGQLTRAVSAVGHEEAESVGRLGVSEFDPLVDAFDDMARRLSERNRELLSLNNRLADLARTDGLTGLANRRTFDVQFSQDWVRARDEGLPLTVVMADVDSFKAFNDTLGHLAGDDALRQVARMLAAAVAGTSYLVARYGGEEFMLLLPGLGLEQGIALADDARLQVEALGIEHPLAPQRRLTISFGVASVVPDGESNPDALISRADAALYEAKRRGRNCVVASDG
mgnify:CR=1 FL=1